MIPRLLVAAAVTSPDQVRRARMGLARESGGARYITMSRHHDGFSMFATKATRYNIVDWTPYRRDPLKALADECRRQGVKLFFYLRRDSGGCPEFTDTALD